MNKNSGLIGILAVLLFVSGCGTGASNSASVSAVVSSGNCATLTSSESCAITLSYNTNGVFNPVLGYSPIPLPTSITNIANGDTFNNTFSACANTVATSGGSFSCAPIVITYESAGNGIGTNTNLVFSFGGNFSNGIKIIGN